MFSHNNRLIPALIVLLVTILLFSGCKLGNKPEDKTETNPVSDTQTGDVSVDATTTTAVPEPAADDDTQEAPAFAYISTGEEDFAVLRSAPDDSASALSRLYDGDRIQVKSLSGDWSSVRYNEFEGYIRNIYIVFGNPEPSEPVVIVTTSNRLERDENGVVYPGCYPNYMPYNSAVMAYCSADSVKMYKTCDNSEPLKEAFRVYRNDAVYLYGAVNGFYYLSTYDGSGSHIAAYVPISAITIGEPPVSDSLAVPDSLHLPPLNLPQK